MQQILSKIYSILNVIIYIFSQEKNFKKFYIQFPLAALEKKLFLHRESHDP